MAQAANDVGSAEATEVGVVGTTGSSSMVSYEIDDSSSISLKRNANGHTVLLLPATSGVRTFSDTVENCVVSETTIRLTEKKREEGWTYLHISTIKNDVDVVKYILSKFRDGEERRQFIDEVDKMGWTSLHWGAALDQVEAVEATMSKMSEDHVLRHMTSNWTLLHASAKGDAGKVMQHLMTKIRAEEKGKWKILTCPTGDGQTALHIAVAEGNIRTAILLLDLAGEEKERLLTAKDCEGRTASEFSSQFPLLGEYLRLSTKMDDLVLHAAARNNDRFMVSWTLEDVRGERKMEWINKRNADGLTALQVASEANNATVIKEIARILTEEEFMSCMDERTVDGNTALHVAAMGNSASNLHALLSSASQGKRKQLLALTNLDQETALDVAIRQEHKLAADILKYHEMIMGENGLYDFFHRRPYSYFSISWTPELVKIKYERIEPRTSNDSELVGFINFDAAACLLHGDTTKAAEFIAPSTKGDSIHAWCNKGVLELGKGSLLAAERAAFSILELMAEESGIFQARAEMEFAYFLAETERTDEAREKCYEIMEQCRQKFTQDTKLKENLSYHFIKTLVRQLRSTEKFNKPAEWLEKKLETAVDHFLVLHRSENQATKADMWLWLAELQDTRIDSISLEKALKVFSREAEIEKVNIETCLNQTYEIIKKVPNEGNTMLRIGRLCLNCGHRNDQAKNQKLYWFEKAVKLSEEWLGRNSWNIMAASTCAHGLMQTWAIKFFEKKADLVKECYEQLYGRGLDHDQDAWNFLFGPFYSPNISSEQTTQQYLPQVTEYLKRIVKAPEGWSLHGLKHARVKYLLGEPRQSVEADFRRAIDGSNDRTSRVKAYEQFGTYFLAEKRYECAKQFYQQALDEAEMGEGKKYKPKVAKMGLKSIDRLNRRNRY